MRKRTKTLKLARRMIRYNITYDAAKKNFIPELNLLYFTQAETMKNKRRRLIGYL